MRSLVICIPHPILLVIRSIKMRWFWHVARVGEGRGCTTFRWRTHREKDHWVKPDLDGRIILRWVFRNLNLGLCPGLSWFMIETGGGHM